VSARALVYGLAGLALGMFLVGPVGYVDLLQSAGRATLVVGVGCLIVGVSRLATAVDQLAARAGGGS
jgi:hypothetical protein